MKKILLSVGIGLLLLTGCTKIPKTANNQEVVAKVEGKEFSVDELYEKLKKSYGANTLVSMIDDYIISVEITDRADAVTYGESELAAAKTKYEGYANVIGYTWEEYMQNNGFSSEEEMKTYYENSYLKDTVAIKYIIPDITDKEVKKYYDEEVDDKIVARHILIAPKTTDSMSSSEKEEAEQEAYNKAAEIITKLNEGGNFIDLAKEFSDDNSSTNGGLIDPFTSDDVVKEFWEASLKLEVGKYSTEPVKSQYGYHIILKDSVIAKDSLESMTDQIKNTIAEDKLEDDDNLLYKTWFEIRKKYNFDVIDSDMKYLYDLSQSQYINE